MGQRTPKDTKHQDEAEATPLASNDSNELGATLGRAGWTSTRSLGDPFVAESLRSDQVGLDTFEHLDSNRAEAPS